ncbi:MAG: phytanoyl-CoA dioxygenase family protein [Planctomycetota bacterium]|nr:phytanoyl-CoA dioxygenase family protein [Planctomycetota bacterium]
MTAATPAFTEPLPATLDAGQVARFHREGYLAFESLLEPGEVEAGRRAMSEMLQGLAARAKAGELKVERAPNAMRNYSGCRVVDQASDSGVLFEPGLEIDPARMSVEELDRTYRKLIHPAKGHAFFRRLAEDARLTNVLDALLGPGAVLYSSDALCKPARIGSPKPWHQDSAYFLYEPAADGVDVWIALDDAAADNGCMFVLPGAHRLGPKQHVHRDDCTLADGRLDYGAALPVELRAGGVLFFSTLLPHHTPPNRSDRRRRAAQFFYRGPRTRLIGEDEKRRTYLEADGTPASCAAAGAERRAREAVALKA